MVLLLWTGPHALLSANDTPRFLSVDHRNVGTPDGQPEMWSALVTLENCSRTTGDPEVIVVNRVENRAAHAGSA